MRSKTQFYNTKVSGGQEPSGFQCWDVFTGSCLFLDEGRFYADDDERTR